MPTAPPRKCRAPNCPADVTGRAAYCPTHAVVLEHSRPNYAQRRQYRTRRWRQLRADVLYDAAQTCAACGHVFPDLDVDHKTPAAEDPTRFWDPANLQALCKVCHSAKTARGE